MLEQRGPAGIAAPPLLVGTVQAIAQGGAAGAFRPAWEDPNDCCLIPNREPVCLSPAPIFFGLPPHRFARRIFHLNPVRETTGCIARILALRNDALQAEFAGMLKHERAILVLQVFVKLDPGAGACK